MEFGSHSSRIREIVHFFGFPTLIKMTSFPKIMPKMTSSNERIHFYVKDFVDAMEIFIASFHLT